MMNKVDTLYDNMAKDIQLNIRVTSDVKRLIEAASTQNSQTTSSYILWVLSQVNPDIAKATNILRGPSMMNNLYHQMAQDASDEADARNQDTGLKA